MRKRTRYPDESFTDYGESAILKSNDTHKVYGINLKRKNSFSSEWFDIDKMDNNYERGINAQCHLFAVHSNCNQIVYKFEDYDDDYGFYDVVDWELSELYESLFRMDCEI